MNNNKNFISEAKKFYKNKNFLKAKNCLLEALKFNNLDKTLILSINVLISDICYKLNEFENAKNYLLQSTKNGYSNWKIFNSLGNIYLKLRDYKEAEIYFLKSIKIEKDNEVSLVNLAILYHNLGKEKKAISFYKKVLKKNPQNIGALYNLSNIDKNCLDKNIVSDLKNHVKRKNLANFDIAACYYLLAKVEREKKNHDKEIDFLYEANFSSFKESEKKNLELNKYWLENIPKKIGKINYKQKKNFSIETENIYPIFIIGLPRSGSTLIESIITSGNNVENLGETNLVNWAILNTNRDIFISKDTNEEIQIDLNKIKEKLLNALQNLNLRQNDKIFFSEKSLENFFYIETILKIFPNAKFIHPYRNLIDNVLAIYNQFLPSISWSHKLENILLYINNYLRIIDIFKKKYPLNIFSISLEKLTNNPKKFSMEIYKFCNIEWNEECLNFHSRNDLFISTASNNQMRGNIKKYDIRKYEPYKKIIKPYLKKYDWINF